MIELLKQISGMIGAAIAAACCLGISAVLAAVGAVGLGFVAYDAYLFPIFVGFIALSLWLLFRSARRHDDLKPFWLSLVGGVVGSIALWFMVTGIFPLAWLVYTSLAMLFAGSVWDFVRGRRAPQCAPDQAATAPSTGAANPGRRAVTGAALSAGAAVAFYGLYKSVQAIAPQAHGEQIACWGINSCKGQGACSTAFNACTGQNSCKGKGYIYVPAKECYARGGEPLKGSPGDPSKG